MVDLLTPLPDPPTRLNATSNDELVARSDAWFVAQGTLVTEMNTALQWIEDTAASLVSAGFSATSTASLTIGAGVKSFAATPGAAFTGGQSVVIASDADPTKSMTGTLTEYDRSTGNMTVDVTTYSGSGTFASWSIGLALVADLSGYVQKSGAVMTGLLTLAAAQGLLLTPGAAPAAKQDGHVWREANKMVARIGAVDFDFVFATISQTLTQKNLTSPTINGGTISAATISAGTISGATIGGSSVAQRVVAAGATTGTLTPNCGTTDVFMAAGLTGGVTIATPSGAPGSEQKLTVHLEDNGTARTIVWATGAGGFRAGKDVTLPTSTTVGKWVRVACWWNAADGYWDVLAVVAQA